MNYLRFTESTSFLDSRVDQHFESIKALHFLESAEFIEPMDSISPMDHESIESISFDDGATAYIVSMPWLLSTES